MLSRRLRGFTIIELMITLVIMSLLMAAAALSITTSRASARDAKRISDAVLISDSIEQSAALSRGIYPAAPVGGGGSVMCANQLLDATNPTINPYNLDLSKFPGRVIPTDPKPYTKKLTGCTSYQDGYVYRAPVDAKPRGYTYLIEIGLEREKNTDETYFVNATQFGAAAITSPRFQYYLLGKYCGSAC